MTEIENITPNLMVNDVNETIKFYEDILGFTLLRSVPEVGQIDWAMMKKNAGVIMFQSKKSLSNDLHIMQGRKPGGGTTLYIKMKGIADFFENISEKVEIVADIEHTFYDTKEFTIIDINGYVITFAEDLEK